MPEAFKNFINAKLIEDMALQLAAHIGEDQANRLIADVTPRLEALELKERSRAITDCLLEIMPDDFEKSCDILKSIIHPEEGIDLSNMVGQEDGLRGWAIMPIADYVADAGASQISHAFPALEALTSRFSAEFAIRPFIRDHFDASYEQLNQWALSPNEHVRRLASEGSRPRLPWGIRLQNLIKDPKPLFPLLEILIDDPSEYVRRSVANNLNDIAKDHPEQVLDFVEKWLIGADKNRLKLLNHACRTLFKQGNPRCLSLFGFDEVKLKNITIELNKDVIKFGESIDFSVSFSSDMEEETALMIDYAIHFVKANGQKKPKVFKWSKQSIAPNETIEKSKSHAIKSVTVRSYYAGIHSLEILVNGHSLGMKDFLLKIE